MQIVLAQHIVMRMKYVYQRNGVSYYQRQIPKDLRDRYPTSGPIKINLETNECVVVGSKVAKLNKQYEALWDAMRKDPSLSPEKTQDEAKKLLKRFGVELRGDSPEANLEGLCDFFEAKRQAHADRQSDPEEAYMFASDSEFLNKTEQVVVKLLQGKEEFLLSDALDFYLNEHPKRGRLTFPKLEEDARRVWGKLTALLGDKIFTEVTRDHARLFRDSLMVPLSTGSVRRSLNTVCAVFRFAIKERTIQGHNNVFEGLTIAGEGLDTRKRESLDAEQLKLLREKCLAADDPMRWVLSIQMDAGSRIAEVVGLALEDIHIEGVATPYVDFKPHPWRTLKTDGSIRKVPLVGHALWAAQRVVETARKGQRYAFPQYIRDGLCNADSASASLNKWMRSQGINKTTHCFRHTMRDRLRHVGAPKDIQDAVGGWGKASIGENYGEGYALDTLRHWMQKTSE